MASVTTNRFGDLILRSQDVPQDIDEFIDALEELVKRGQKARAPCIWVNLEDTHIQQTLAVLTAGFESFQVVSTTQRVPPDSNGNEQKPQVKRFVRYRRVLDDSVTDNTFMQASHYASVSAVVVDPAGNVLCVRDAFPGRKADAPKLITGEIKHNETIEDAAVREVYEEVGLVVQSRGILGFWHNTHGPNGLGSLLFGVLLSVKANGNTALRANRKEIKNAAWYPMDAARAMFEDRPEEAWLRAATVMTLVSGPPAAFKRWTGYLSGYAGEGGQDVEKAAVQKDNAVYSGRQPASQVSDKAMNPVVSSSPAPPPSSPSNNMSDGGKANDNIIGASASSVIPAGSPSVGGTSDVAVELLGSWTGNEILNVSSPVSGTSTVSLPSQVSTTEPISLVPLPLPLPDMDIVSLSESLMSMSLSSASSISPSLSSSPFALAGSSSSSLIKEES